MSELGDRLCKLRTDRHYSQEELGKVFHVSRSTICAFEKGTREPNLEFLRKYAEFFEASYDYMLLGIGDGLSPSILSEPFYKDKTLHDLVNAARAIHPENRKAFWTILVLFSKAVGKIEL